MTDEISSQDSTDPQILTWKSKDQILRAEKRFLMVLFSLLPEVGYEQNPENALSLYDDGTVIFTNMSAKKRMDAATKMIEELQKHITQNGTPNAYKQMQDFMEFPDYLRARAVVLATFDLKTANAYSGDE